MAWLSPKVIAQVSSRSASELAATSWEWIMRADGQVLYRLTEVNGRLERNPWNPVDPAASSRAAIIRGDKTKATEAYVIVRQHGHRR